MSPDLEPCLTRPPERENPALLTVGRALVSPLSAGQSSLSFSSLVLANEFRLNRARPEKPGARYWGDDISKLLERRLL